MGSISEASSRKQMLVVSGLLFEQAAISLPNFLYFPFLARVLSQSEFAVVALGFTIYLVGISLYDTAICDPISIIDHTSSDEETLHVRLLWTVTALMVAALLPCAVVLHAIGGLWPASISLTLLILSSFMVITLLRRLLHRAKLTKVSFLAAAGYFLAFASTVAAIYLADRFSPVAAIAPFLTGALVFLALARRAIPALLLDQMPPERIVRNHARVASGSFVFALFANLTMNIYPPIFALNGDQRAIAAFRLISSTFTPFFQLPAALYGFLLPQVGRGVPLPRTYLLAILGTISLPLLALAVSLKWGPAIAALAFGRGYEDLGLIMPIAFLGVFLSITLGALGLLIRAKQHLMTLRFMGVIQFAVTAVLAAHLVGLWGIGGAFTTYAIANAAGLALACASLLYQRRTRGSRADTLK